jgi:hypothetical protein
MEKNRRKEKAMVQQITTDWKAMYEVLQECNADLEQRCKELEETNLNNVAMADYQIAELKDGIALLRRRLELVDDEEIVDRTYHCHEASHTEGWCQHCDDRLAGIEEYYKELKRCMELKEGE